MCPGPFSLLTPSIFSDFYYICLTQNVLLLQTLSAENLSSITGLSSAVRYFLNIPKRVDKRSYKGSDDPARVRCLVVLAVDEALRKPRERGALWDSLPLRRPLVSVF